MSERVENLLWNCLLHRLISLAYFVYKIKQTTKRLKTWNRAKRKTLFLSQLCPLQLITPRSENTQHGYFIMINQISMFFFLLFFHPSASVLFLCGISWLCRPHCDKHRATILTRQTIVCVCRQEFISEACPDLTKEVYLQDIHCVGSLCKLYFRELPNPLLTYELYAKFTVSTFEVCSLFPQS